MTHLRVELELPRSVLLAAKISEQELPKELKKLLALKWFEMGVLSLGKACELAGISQWEFFELNRQAQIPLHYDEADFTDDLETLRKAFP